MTALHSEEENVLDIRLLCNEADQQRYACGRCGTLAVNTKSLSCDEHPQELTLFCEKCAIIIQNENQCPVNKHSNPIFIDAKILRAEIDRKLQFICPYSSRFQQKHHDNVAAPFVHDTMQREGRFDDEKRPYASGCEWKGVFRELKNHIKMCPFKPKTDKRIAQLTDEIDKLKNIVHSLQNIQTENAAKNEQRLNELHQRTETVAQTLTTNVDTLKRKMDALHDKDKHTVDKHVQTPHKPSETLSKSGMFLGFLCCVLLSIIVGIVYDHHRKISLLTDTNTVDDCNVNETFDEMMQNITVRIDDLVQRMDDMNMRTQHLENRTISMNDLKYRVREMERNWTEKIDAMNLSTKHCKNEIIQGMNEDMAASNVAVSVPKEHPQIDDNPLDEGPSVISKVLQFLRWVGYYAIKLLAQGFTIIFMLFMAVMEGWQHYWSIIFSTISHLLIKTFYFYPSDWMDWSVLWIVIGLNCVLCLVRGKPPVSKNSKAMHAFAWISLLNTMYWRMWCNDDRVWNVVVLPWFLFLLYIQYTDQPNDKKRKCFYVSGVLSLVITIGLLFK